MYWDGSYFLHDDLDAAWRHTSKGVNLTPYTKMMYVAAIAIRHFLGREWSEKYLFANSFGFMSANLKSLTVEREAERDVVSMRIIELAEMLLNFQDSTGFESILAELETPGKLAPTFGALEIGMFLRIGGNQVAFRVPGKSKESYDFDLITASGLPVCVEAKCVLKSDQNASSTIHNRLKKAMRQLPAGRDGAVCVRVPDHWLSNDLIFGHFKPVAEQLLRGTRRVVAVALLTNRRYIGEDARLNAMFGREIFNERSNPGGTRVKLVRSAVVIDNWFYLCRFFGLNNELSPEQASGMRQIFPDG